MQKISQINIETDEVLKENQILFDRTNSKIKNTEKKVDNLQISSLKQNIPDETIKGDCEEEFEMINQYIDDFV